ncbi:unnamed protein product [Rhizoctonia solani]|uniref:MYND-type domain-containing protein n=1 Tax=Rhizoctonia solani TaxID=456999 RepID=A0A8H3DFH4_9AGAM|nr:unnamed protein product [Rhizoctonia solani]
MTDHDQVHPRWGRPLDQYVHSWNSHSCVKSGDWDARTEAEIRTRAMVAIAEVCTLDRESNSEHNTKVTISMLQAILELSKSPVTFAELGYPGLVDGCLRLMLRVKYFGITTPFIYEYGYLCFRILTLSLGVCFLQRTERFDATIARMREAPGTEPFLIFSEEVSRLVYSFLSDSEGADRCDWMLGLRDLKQFGPFQMLFTAFLGHTKLLSVLGHDQKHLSKALTSICSPGLSGVLCLLWRYVKLCQDRIIKDDDPDLILKFCMVYNRYCLVAPSYEDDVLILMYQRNSDWWTQAHQSFIDIEDEREKFLIYNGRLASTSSGWLSQPSVSLLPIMLQFLVSGIPDGVEDLLPQLLGLTIGRLWQARLSNESSGDRFLEVICHTMSFLGSAFYSLYEKSYSNHSVTSEIIDALVQSDMFDFLIQTLFLLPMRPSRSPPEEDPDAEFVRHAILLYQSASEIIPEELFQPKFRSLIPSARRYLCHAFQRTEMDNDCAISQERFDLMMHCITGIACHMGIDDELQDVNETWGFCVSAQCPDPQRRTPELFACGRCGTTFCSRRCQARDWVPSNSRGWHRMICGKVVQ